MAAADIVVAVDNIEVVVGTVGDVAVHYFALGVVVLDQYAHTLVAGPARSRRRLVELSLLNSHESVALDSAAAAEPVSDSELGPFQLSAPLNLNSNLNGSNSNFEYYSSSNCVNLHWEDLSPCPPSRLPVVSWNVPDEPYSDSLADDSSQSEF
jgi:hypothetical protein